VPIIALPLSKSAGVALNAAFFETIMIALRSCGIAP
jgi:hypothetical protein